MPTVLMIRHGENDYVTNNRLAGRLPGVHLNEKGREQAKAVAELLKEIPLKAIYSSPLERAIETAEPLAKSHDLNINICEGLNETDYGDWEGKTLKSLHRRKLWRFVQNSPSLMRFPNGESFAEAQLRVCGEIDSISKQHKPKDILACVLHSDPIKLAVAFYTGIPLDNFQRLVVTPSSITAIHLRDDGSQLLTLNFDLSLTLITH